MLFLHDVHAAIGEHEIELDEAVRDVYAPTIADDDARLAWYLYSTHGAGEAYIVNVITALRDGAAWERLARRLRYGDLAEWLLQVDTLTYWSQSTLHGLDRVVTDRRSRPRLVAGRPRRARRARVP